MSALLAAAAEQPMSWPDVIGLGLFFAFLAFVFYLVTRWWS